MWIGGYYARGSIAVVKGLLSMEDLSDRSCLTSISQFSCSLSSPPSRPNFSFSVGAISVSHVTILRPETLVQYGFPKRISYPKNDDRGGEITERGHGKMRRKERGDQIERKFPASRFVHGNNVAGCHPCIWNMRIRYSELVFGCWDWGSMVFSCTSAGESCISRVTRMY